MTDPRLTFPPPIRRLLESWRSKSTTPVTSPRRSAQAAQPAPFGAAPLPPAPTASGSSGPSAEPDEYDDDDDAGFWRVPITRQELAACGGLHSPFSPDATSPFWERGLQKSGSSSSLPNNHSIQSSLELPLPLEAPVMGETQTPALPPHSRSNSGLPPLPGSARQVAAAHSAQQSAELEPYERSPPGPGAAAGTPSSAGAGLSRLDSAERRHAGTAQWVFDRQNSAGSEAYKSLLIFLDHQSPRTQPLPTGSGEASDADGGTGTGPSPRTPTGASAPASPGPDTPPAPPPEEDSGPWAEPSAAHLQRSSAVNESGEDEGDAGEVRSPLAVGPAPAAAGDDSLGLSRVSSLTESVVADALGGLALCEDEGEEEEGEVHTPTRAVLPAVKIGGGRAASPIDSTAATAGGGSPSLGGKGDPFSFPVTSPSEAGAAEQRPPGQLFGSWPSFKALDGAGGDEDEEELTPGSKARRGHRARLSTASSAANVAGLVRSGPGLAMSRFPGMARSGSSAALGPPAATPLGAGQYGDLALYEYDEDVFEEKYDVFELRVIHRRGATGFEATRELPLRVNDLIAGRYQIVDLLGQAAFCRAVQALDLKTGGLVCLKVVKNNKDYLDQSLDEVKVLRHVAAADPGDEAGVLRLYDYFYFKEHLILVTELLRANLYEFAKYNREGGGALYFTPPRIQSIARQVLRSLAFLHSLGLIHADLKPENILMKSYSQCEVKVIDLGSSCFVTDRLSSYVQSRSYRAPEVILGLPYGQKIDVWSLGCIVAELASGRVLFHNASPAAILARVEGILGAFPAGMLSRGRYAPRFYTADGRLYERNREAGTMELLRPKRTSLGRRVPEADAGMLDFMAALLQVDPARRPTASEALAHPWLQHRY